MAILEGGNLWIKRARLSFPAIVKPKSSAPGAEPAYSCDFILDPDAVEWGELAQMIQQMAATKWADKAEGVLKHIAGEKRLRCYGVGADKTNNMGEIYSGYEEGVYIGGRNTEQPQLIGADAQPLPPTANLNQLFAGGNHVSGIVNIWLQDNQYGKAIRGKLVAVQYLDEGEKFGAVDVDATSVFAPVAGAPAAAAGAIPMPGTPDPLG